MVNWLNRPKKKDDTTAASSNQVEHGADKIPASLHDMEPTQPGSNTDLDQSQSSINAEEKSGEKLPQATQVSQGFSKKLKDTFNLNDVPVDPQNRITHPDIVDNVGVLKQDNTISNSTPHVGQNSCPDPISASPVHHTPTTGLQTSSHQDTDAKNNGLHDHGRTSKDLVATIASPYDDVENDDQIQPSQPEVDGTVPSERIVCDVCLKGFPELCCFMCDPEGIPYHTECWATERLHRPRRDQNYLTHQSMPIACIGRLRYLNEPNKEISVDESKFQEDELNCFIKFSIKSRQFRFGHRAFPLLRHGHDKDLVRYPSFVSFVGRTMNGKSFLIRALHTEEDRKLPTPIPAPGAKSHNHDSTSSDIHLYPDSTTTCDESPILFLDCEGFGGSDVPESLKAKLSGSIAAAERRTFVEAAYPRLVYAFSTCIVFVTSGPLAGADDIKRRLISYASQGASGSTNQGFKPSLFVVFNRFRDGNKPDFDWSIDSSSKAFLADRNRREKLENFYSNIRVIYIPSMDREAAIALQQIDVFEEILRAEHKEAFLRRREFRLDFTSQQLLHVLKRALEIFSKDSNSVFDWSVEATHLQFDYSDPAMPLRDMWMQYTKHHTTPNSPQMPYDLVRSDFEKHVMICLRLELKRHPQPGSHYTHVPPNWTKNMQQLYFDYAPRGASLAQLKCEKVRLRHGDHHQSLYIQGLPVMRWTGDYKPCEDVVSQTFQESFEAAIMNSEMKDVSLNDLRILSKDIRSVVSCLGCLQGPPSTVLACGHAFCFNCIRELTHPHPSPHQLEGIQCPIHQELQEFSPRLLPIQSGYRILSLDGGGVKGLAQLVMLKHIEEKCFGIPSMHLFDLVVGTNVGGQIALALSTRTSSGLATATATTEKFRELMKDAFDRKLLGFGVVSSATKKTKYKNSKLESELQDFYGDARLFSAVTSSRSGLPNIAVTTVVQESSEAHLVTNYNRKPSADALPILLGPNPADCLSLWAAARCTSAAVPYFKPLQWQGRMLIDGGFKFNCPATCAHSEAKCIWPNARCDTLLSLGTGRTTNPQPRKADNKRSRIAQEVPDEMTDAEEAWTKFKAELLQKDGVFRLNPTYIGTGYAMDKHRKLNEIEKQVEEWIATQKSPLTHICHQLIAALFFFRLLKPAGDGVQAGEIVCRLPIGLKERQNLIRHMLLEDDSKLFVVECDGRSDETRQFVNVPPTFRDLDVTDELCLRVDLRNLPATGELKIHIRMRSLGICQPGDTQQWLPISGSPYLIQEFE